MKPICHSILNKVVGVELTRRNLQALLAKLDEPNSKRTIVKDGFFVTALEDEEHYVDRQPGPMTTVTEATITKMRENNHENQH